MDDSNDLAKSYQVFTDSPRTYIERGADPNGPPAMSDDALKQLKNDAEAGNADAQLRLALAYSRGIDLPRDRGERTRWLLASATGGNVLAQFYVGISYMEGVGLEKDFSKARHWLEVSRSQGNETAEQALKKLNSMSPP